MGWNLNSNQTVVYFEAILAALRCCLLRGIKSRSTLIEQT
jgi:hypothetical protein